ncbi:MAG: PIN domain-containing protein [Anaerolineaceae bacterium]|nr:PIN domain-containing protein [Anaerolineaceae bacterium]
MKLLLDTHTFIWWISKPNQLSANARSFLDDENNEPVMSVVNIWEIQIKNAVGKMDVNFSLDDIVETYRVNGIEILPIYPSHVLRLSSLPNHHHDPFDRILIAQATVENMTILSKDTKIKQYPVSVIW